MPIWCLLELGNNDLLSGGADYVVKRWDLEAKTCTCTFEGHAGPIWCMTILDGLLVTGSEDNTVKLWDLDTGESVRTLLAHSNAIWGLSTARDEILVTGSWDKTLKIWTFVRPQPPKLPIGNK
eukprot:TRINITY_DN8527_c0_g1_i3.p1 TRINITY_DN8527_c0_g1~~TRINITY_DN8527_c0_g1_i3.p1  ORF type:complete len:123 (-),score=21.29 TRINITY_DN8527_c0_g1_i3:36-404(-)